MSKRSDKMYANSPRIESDANGNKVIKKGPKEGPGQPPAGASEKDKKAFELKQKHERERLELSQKHEQEALGFDPATAAAAPAAATETAAT